MADKLRSVNTRFWNDPFIEELSPSEKLLFLYLITNPLCNLLGIYEITFKRISYDTGINTETIRKGFERFTDSSKAFFINNYLVLPNFLKNQNLNSNMKIAVMRQFNELPEWLKINILGNDSKGFGNGSEGFKIITECLGKLKYEVEVEVEVENEIHENKINIAFDIFWNLYDKKMGNKNQCEKKWNKLKDEEREKIIKTLPNFKSQFTDKQFQPFPETYLNQNRWNDEIIQNSKNILRPTKLAM